jgi:hypothetical protein
MAGLVAAIHVFNPFMDLILRRSRSGRLEGASREHWILLRDADFICSSR